MDALPLKKNTVALTTLAMIAALGVVARLFVRFTVIPEFVEITPGFLFSELGGVIGGIPGGVFVGTIVGIGGVLGGGEFSMLPLMGNIFLGIGTGYAIYVTRERDSLKYLLLAVLGGGFIGGFIPDMTIFLYLSESIEAAVLTALIDTAQGSAWAVIAVMLERNLIRPLIGNYIYEEQKIFELEDREVAN
ncbi:hypothetical protein EU537_01700 [Candidatus Thorarchaeota archaeon]|nr:MAG: hypothetical protein EU537_01700 [Candidatus Thorarchaeota archaeon]